MRDAKIDALLERAAENGLLDERQRRTLQMVFYNMGKHVTDNDDNVFS